MCSYTYYTSQNEEIFIKTNGIFGNRCDQALTLPLLFCIHTWRAIRQNIAGFIKGVTLFTQESQFGKLSPKII